MILANMCLIIVYLAFSSMAGFFSFFNNVTLRYLVLCQISNNTKFF